MKKVLILIISMLLPMMANAQSQQVRGTKVDGIYYLFDSTNKTATVTCDYVLYYRGTIDYWKEADYSGAIEIPSEVTYNDVTYKVTGIGDVAFARCTAVTSISIPESVVSIGYSAFLNCSGLPSISIPNDITSIGTRAFLGTAWYNSQPDGLLYLDNWLIGYKGDKPTGELNITDGTKGIAESAFSGCSDLTAVTIPNSVSNIGVKAFYDCTGLTSVELHTQTIGDWFSGLSSIQTITIGSEVESIEDNAFFGCSNIRVNISDLSKWCKISLNRALLYRTYEVYLGMGEGYDQRATVEYYQLYLNGEEITNLVIPDDVESIGSYIFSHCSSLTSVTIGSGVTNIGKYAFDGCQNLTDVYLHSENAPDIGSNAFPYNQNVTFHVPNASYLKQPWVSFGTIVPLSGGEFEGIDKTIITFADATVKQKLMQSCDFDKDGEISMWEAAAANIPSFNSSDITSFNELKYFTGITTLHSDFQNCSKLISVTIPENVTSIVDYAFSGCTSLTQLYCMAEEPPSESKAFDSYKYAAINYSAVDKSNVTLYVPASGYSLYSTQEPWMSFKEILTIDGSEAVVPKCATPTISVVKGKIRFSCETEGVSFESSITLPTSSKSADGTEISLSNKYKVTVCAKKKGHIDSDIAEAEFVGSLIRGDLNNDGKVDVADHVDLTKIIMGQE